MQILQWLFKVTTHDQTRESSSSSPPLNNNKETDDLTDQEANKLKDLVLFKHCGAYNQNWKRVRGSRVWSCKNLKQFGFVCRRDIAKASFYGTLNLKKLGSLDRKQHWSSIHSSTMKKEAIARGLGIGHKPDSAAHVGNKVLPLTDASLTNSNDQCGALEKKDKLRGDKSKALSRMKELLRWAAAAKSEKGGKFIGRKVLHFRNRGTLKTVPDDDQLSSTDSPKISFRWDVESCSTTSSVYSAISMVSSLKNDQIANMLPSVNSTPLHDIDSFTPRKGNWITTDSEFVVLEL